MSTKTWQRIFSYLALAGLLISLVHPKMVRASTSTFDPAPPTASQVALDKIEAQVLEELAGKGQTDFIVVMKEQADLSAAERMKTKVEKGEYVYNLLRVTAEGAQKGLRAYLDQKGVHYTSFYIVNAILVRGGTQGLLMAVAERKDVVRVTANHSYLLNHTFLRGGQPQGVAPTAFTVDTGKLQLQNVGPDSPAGVEPNLTFVNADDVWALGDTGQGTVLAGNETGLYWNHEAIQPHYRGWDGANVDHNYNWWTPFPDQYGNPYLAPVDANGIGTLVAGIMVGDDGAGNQIGMAPGAKTIHCKNTTWEGQSQDAWYIECFEWDLAPWDLTGNNPRPDMAPDVVNVDWNNAFGPGNEVFRLAVDNLQSAGIVVDVPSSDFAYNCSTLYSPGDYQEVMTVGAVDSSSGVLPGVLPAWSGRGPSQLDGNYFPDVVAPGQDIRSSWIWAQSYTYWSTTRAANAHVTGLIGLMWSANPALRGQVAETMQIIHDTAVPLPGQTGYNCGGDYTEGPNNDWGYGTIDALAAVQAAILYHAGILNGTVTQSASGAPIEGANIQASLSITRSYQTKTDASGFYSMNVISGTYTVDATAFGFLPAQATGVVVAENLTTTVDFAMDVAPSHVLSVTVVDVNTGWPLYAVTALGGTPLNPAWNDPLTGHFEVTLPDGSAYSLGVDAWTPGYLHQDVTVGPFNSDTEVVIALEPDLASCTAPGYEPVLVPTVSYDFEANNGGYTIGGSNASWEWGAPVNGPGAAHSGTNVWATNLDGNYNDNENSYLYSPVIDLTSLAGQTVNIAWWQWLQTEAGNDFVYLQVSKDGGVHWDSNLWLSGDADLSWAKHILNFDPSYAVSNFRMRFYLSTNYYLTYPGWYIDDVEVGPYVCTPMEGGLVVGNVYEANEGLPIAGATVLNDSGYSTETAATVDPNVNDGFYVSFSPSGAHTFTASFGAFNPDVETVDVTTGSATWQDFYLTAGHLTFDPLEMQVSLEMGQRLTQTLTIANDGSSPASFVITEFDRGFQPANHRDTEVGTISATRVNSSDVIVVCADYVLWGFYPCDPLGSILIEFGDFGSVTRYDARYAIPTLEELLAYDVVVTYSGDMGYADPYLFGDELADYVDAGGKVINLMYGLTPWGLQGRFVDENYTAMKGMSNQYTMSCLDVYDATYSIMDGITDVCDAYRLYGAYLTPGSSAVAYWSDGELFVAAKDNRSVVSLSMFLGNYNVMTGQGYEVLRNSIFWVTGSSDVPWLSEIPITGTIPVSSSQVVDIIFDASVPEVTQPGAYSAQLKINTDTPYPATTIPITMTVTPPPTYGKLEGTVQGLGYCDVNPAPLEQAEVFVQSSQGYTWSLQTDETGHYQVWMDQANSPLTITVAVQDYLAQTISNVAIVAQQTTTENFDLRLQQPCVDTDPNALTVDLILGHQTTIALNLLNGGAAATDFALSEREGTPLPAVRPAHSAGQPVPEGVSRTQPPEGYAPRLTKSSNAPLHPMGGMVAVFKDADPWATTEVETFLAAHSIPYEIHTSAEFGALDFNAFRMIVISSDQTQTFYNTYAAYADKFEAYVEGGGFLNFFTAPGWNGGMINTPLPGGMAWFEYYDNYNVVDDPDHPVMAGLPNPFFGPWSASYGHFGDLPADAHIIASELSNGMPTIVEYPLGAGWLIAFSQPLEVSHYYGWEIGWIMENTLLWGNTYLPPRDVPWLVESPITGTLAPDSSFPVEVTFTALPTLTVGGIYTAVLLLESADPFYPERTIPVTLNVLSPAYGVEVSSDDSLSGLPGETVVYAVTITNTGNGPSDSFHVSLSASTWATSLDTVMVGPLVAGESAIVHVSVTVPEDVVLPHSDAVQVTAVSQGNPEVSASATLTTVAGGSFGVDLQPEASARDAAPGAVVTYTLRLTNTVEITDTIVISISGVGAAWVSLPQTSFTLAAGEAVDVQVVVAIPPGVDAGDYAVTVTAISAHDPVQSDEVEIITSVIRPYLYLPLVSRAP